MANFSLVTANHLADLVRNSETNVNRARIFPNIALGDFDPEAYLSLHTEGVDLDILSTRGGINNTSPYLNGEVLINSDTNYVRKPVVWSNIFTPGQNVTHPVGVVVPSTQKGYAFFYNAQEVIWNIPPTAPWGTITHYSFAAYAVLREGVPLPSDLLNGLRKVLFWGALASPKEVGAGDIFRFPIGSLQINIY